MRYRLPRLRMFHSVRHSSAMAALLAYLVAAVGVPLPGVTQKDRSVPFPCMDRTCGCHDASGCKQHCCCFTSEQKLAWAAEHDVDPTPFVNDLDLVAALPAEHAKIPAHAAACCVAKPHHPEVPARLADQRSSAAPSVCHEHTTTPSPMSSGNLARPIADPPASDDGMISIAAYRLCHGLAPLWSTLGAGLPPPRPAEYEFLWIAPNSLAMRTPVATIPTLSPPTPPPRG